MCNNRDIVFSRLIIASVPRNSYEVYFSETFLSDQQQTTHSTETQTIVFPQQ